MISIVLTNGDHLRCRKATCRKPFKSNDEVLHTDRGMFHVECNPEYGRRRRA